MATGDKKVNIYLKKFLPQQQITENFLDYLEKQSRDTVFKVFGGSFLLTPNPSITAPLSPSGNDEIDFVTPMEGVDGEQGHILVLDPAYASDIQFENENGVVYHTGLKHFLFPCGTEKNVRTGAFQYVFFEEHIGDRGVPNTVTDDGDETLTIIVDSVCEAGVSNAGRKVRVWKKEPVTDVATLVFEELTVQWNGTNNFVETSSAFGQTLGNITTAAADYECALMGPLVKRNTDLRLDPNVVYTGNVTGAGAGNPPATFDFSDINTFFNLGAIGSILDSTFGFLVDGGVITWDLTNEELSWNANLRWVLPHKDTIFSIAPTTISSMSDGDVLYFTRTAGTGTIVKTLTKVAQGSVPNDPSSEPIAFRSGNDIFFRNGALQLTGDTTPTSGVIDGVTVDLLNFMGAQSESDSDPDYLNALGSAIQDYVVANGISLTRGIKALEQREDNAPKARVLDLNTSSLPAGANPVIDGVTIVDGDDVFFAEAGLEGLYRAANVATATTWTKLSAWGQSDTPNNGSLLSVKEGTLLGLYKRSSAAKWERITHAAITKERNGFVNRGNSEISFTNGTRTFNIQPKAPATEFDFYQAGVPYRKEAADTVVITDTEGLWWVYYDNGVLTATQTFNENIIKEKVFVATLNWDVANQQAILLTDHKHGLVMDGETHSFIRNTEGVAHKSGLALTGTIDDGSANSHAQVSMVGGEILDEDLLNSIVHSAAPNADSFEQILQPIAQIPVYYRDGAAGDLRKVAAGDYPFPNGGGNVQYNEDGSPWALTNVTDLFHYAVFIFATGNQNEPIIAVLGQREDQLLADAQINNTYENLQLGQLPAQEMKALYRLIFQKSAAFTNTVKARLVAVRDLRKISDIKGASDPDAHNEIAGRDAADSHPSSAISTKTDDFRGAADSSDDNMEKFAKTLDDHFKALRILEHPTNKQRVIVTGASVTLANGVVLEQQQKNLIVNHPEIQIDFQTGEIFQQDGTTPFQGGAFDFTPTIPPAGQNRWASLTFLPSTDNVDQTINLQPLVQFSSATNTRASFASGIKVGQVKLDENSSAIADILYTNNAITRQGVGGSGDGGAGDANSFLQDIKARARRAFFKFFTPNIFSQQGQDETDAPNTTASFDIANGEYDFSAVGQILATIQQLGSRFLGTSTPVDAFADQDLSKCEIHLLYRSDAVDPAPVVRVSRDGRVEFQTVTMKRLGLSNRWMGEHSFTDELTDTDLHEFAESNADAVINLTDSGSGVKRALKFNVTDKEAQKKLTLYLNKLGSAVGKAYVDVVTEDALLPSLLVDARIGGSNIDAINIATLAAGDNTVEIDLSRTITKAGAYWVVIQTNQEYKNNFNSGVDELRLRVDASAPTDPVSASFDDSTETWSAIAGTAIVYKLAGMKFDLRVEVESSVNDASLLGMAALYLTRGFITESDLLLEHTVEIADASIDTNVFTIPSSKFKPDPRFLEAFDVFEKDVHVHGAFRISGQDVIFPEGTFFDPAGGRKIVVFKQYRGGSFDNNPDNASLLAENRLGSLDPNLDKSADNEGIILRVDKAGTSKLVEASLRWDGAKYVWDFGELN